MRKQNGDGEAIRPTRIYPALTLTLTLALALAATATGAFAGEGRAPTIREVRGWDWVQEQTWALLDARPLANAARQVEYAYELEKGRRWGEAAGHYYLAVVAWPGSPEAPLALQRLALALYAMSDHHRAFRAIDQIFDSYPATAGQSGYAENLLAVELRIANRLLDLSEEPARRAEYNEYGVYLPTVAEYELQAENVLDVMVMRLDGLIDRAQRPGDEVTLEKRLALARAVARAKARLPAARR